MMKGFEKCKKGHFYREGLKHCPYCLLPTPNAIAHEEKEDPDILIRPTILDQRTSNAPIDYGYAKIDSLKLSLKMQLSESIPKCIEELGMYLSAKSGQFNQIILLKGRLAANSNQAINGTASKEGIDLENNRIRNSLLELIDGISEDDLHLRVKPWKFKLQGIRKVLIESRRKDLLISDDVMIRFDFSPDKIPRFLQIKRTEMEFLGFEIEKMTDTNFVDCIEALESKANQISRLKDSILDPVRNPIGRFPGTNQVSYEEIVGDLLLQSFQLTNLKNLFAFEHLGHSYVSDKDAKSILPNTVLHELIGNTSPFDEINGATRGNSMEDIGTASVKIQSDSRRNREITKKLVFPFENDHVLIGSFQIGTSRNKLLSTRLLSSTQYLPESLDRLNPRYEVVSSQETLASGLVLDKGEYDRAIFRMLQDKRSSLFLKVDRNEIVKSFDTLIAEVEQLHEKGLAHCDISPKNVLLLESGFFPIDSLDVNLGSIAHALTINYCAPEQILRRPVSPATDIYNIGLMILRLIGGSLIGKLDEFVVPSHNNLRQRVKLVTEPFVLFRQDSQIVQNAGRDAWGNVVSNCLCFRQEDRYQTIAEFRNDFISALSEYPLVGQIRFKPNFGGLTLIKEDCETIYVGRLIGDAEFGGDNRYDRTRGIINT